MDFDFLNSNLFNCLSFKKNYYFKTKPFLQNLKISALDYFLLDRFIQHNSHIQNPSNWSLDKINKTAFFMAKDKISIIEAEFHKFQKQSLNEQISYLLTDEYGYLLPEINDGQWELVEVPLKNLIMPNEKYVKNLAKEIIDDYILQLNQGKDLIGGLYLPRNEYFRLIDGYHRLSALKQFFATDHLVYIISYNKNS